MTTPIDISKIKKLNAKFKALRKLYDYGIITKRQWHDTREYLTFLTWFIPEQQRANELVRRRTGDGDAVFFPFVQETDDFEVKKK